MKNQGEKIKGTIKTNMTLMDTPLMSILPGQISFFVILSIIPLMSILVMIISKLSFSFDSVTNFISHYLPAGATNVVLSIIEQQKAGAIDFLFIVTALYLASKATHSIIVASTQIYNGKQTGFLRTRVKAIIMLIIIIILAVLTIGVFTLGSKIINYIVETNGTISPIINVVYKMLRWPFVIFMIFLAVKIMYTISPNVNIPSKTVNKGAVFTTLVCSLSTYGYSFYVTNIANYTKFYGNLSNIIILMIWIYWLCYIFVYGMTLNEYHLTNKNIDE